MKKCKFGYAQAARPAEFTHPVPFFTGRVGKTSLSTAVALHLADCGKQVLLVSTDSASNLDEMLGVLLATSPHQCLERPVCPCSQH